MTVIAGVIAARFGAVMLPFRPDRTRKYGRAGLPPLETHQTVICLSHSTRQQRTRNYTHERSKKLGDGFDAQVAIAIAATLHRLHGCRGAFGDSVDRNYLVSFNRDGGCAGIGHISHRDWDLGFASKTARGAAQLSAYCTYLFYSGRNPPRNPAVFPRKRKRRHAVFSTINARLFINAPSKLWTSVRSALIATFMPTATKGYTIQSGQNLLSKSRSGSLSVGPIAQGRIRHPSSTFRR